MMQMAPDHFANDPLSAQEENVVYSIRHFTKHFLTSTINRVLAHVSLER